MKSSQLWIQQPLPLSLGAKASQGSNLSKRSTSGNLSSSHLFYSRQAFFLLFPARASSLDDVDPPSWSLPRYPKPTPTIHSSLYGASTNDAKGSSTEGCLAKSPALFCRGATPLAWVMMELMMITLRTSLLHKKLGIQGHHRIEADFD